MSLTSLKQNKTEKTNKQKERWRGHRNSLAWPITTGPDTNKKKKKKKYLKNTAIQEKLELHTTSYWTRQGMSTTTF